LLQALEILEGFDLRSMAQENRSGIDAAVETLKLAMADGDSYYADPLFVEISIQQLLDSAYAAECRKPLHVD
jgi:gamma-glutamyltranspeptidase/glutathione hydrolase